MPQWEYKSVKHKTNGLLGGIVDTDAFDAALNELGKQGWELVGVFDTNLSNGATRDLVTVFKKPLP